MYEDYWGLQEKPFLNHFDPRYTFISKDYEEVFSRLTYADSQNFSLVLLSGDIGSGKSFIIRNFIRELTGSNATAGLVVNPMYSPTEFLKAVSGEFGLDDVGDNKVDILGQLVSYVRENHYQKTKTYLFVDEAQTIEDRMTWEELRMLLNYVEEGLSLFRLVLVGTPNFLEKVKDVPGLWQRVELKSALGGLAEDEMAPYLEHRLSVAGAEKNLFDEDAGKLLYEKTGGILREINLLADLALLSACGDEAESVTTEHIEKAVEEYAGREVTETLETFVGNSLSKVVHAARCIELPDRKHQVFFKSVDEAREAGYVLCDLCLSRG